ncbi:decarboxylase [Candidatus Woesearchaeota archaeon]|nr:MAG: decarboxylase [Candidatus Woesearchaeota archaeon]
MAKPRFLLSRSKVLEQYNALKKLGIAISYSVKTNAEVAKILEQETDCMFSIHNPKNLAIINDKSRVWFFPQAWKKSDIEWLLSEGVRNFVVDNTNDLQVLVNYLKNSPQSLNLLLRMRLKEHTIFTGRYFVFGMPASIINEWVPKLKPLVGKLGVHFHRKTQNVSEWRLKEELEQTLSKETLEAIDLVNIGGGFPAQYKNTSDQVMDMVVNEIKSLKAWLGKLGISIIAEPGRFIAAPAVKLEVEVINVYERNIIVNCSVYSAAMDTIVVPIKLMVEGELEPEQAEGAKPYTIKGISPDSMDIFRYKVFLKPPRVGDKLIFLNAGAYNYYCDFCNYDKPETVIVD